jgi:hypothetical protein
LARDTVLASSAGGTTPVAFSAGVKDVFNTAPAAGLVLVGQLASTNTPSTVVLRDGSGNFSAGTITANLTGNISGTAPAGTLTGTTLASNVVSSSLTSVGTLANLTVTNPITGSVTGSSGSTTGNAATATALQTPRTINGVSFNGTADITVPAAAGTLTGATLAAGVTASSLTSVGTLSSLTVSGASNLSGKVTVTTTSEVAAFGSSSATNAYVAFFRDSTTLGFIGNAGGIMTGGGATDFGITSTGSRPLVFGSADLPRMTIDASGNVGIGVTPSGWDGTIAGPVVFGTSAKGSLSYTGGATSLADNFYRDAGGFKYVTTGTAGLYQVIGATHAWYNAASGTAGNAITLTQAMTLDASGNLGIGVTPTQRLHVSGTTLLAGALTFTADNTHDIGASGATRPRDVYIGTKVVTPAVAFPATQVASADPNTLDDYEEGTFTATLTTATSGTITLVGSGDLVSYTKIGRQVTISGLVQVASVASPVGVSVRLNTLPFTVGNIGELASRFVGTAEFFDNSTGTRSVVPIITAETLAFAFFPIDAATIEANDELLFTLTYFA